MTEEQMELHEGSPHGKAIHLGHIFCRIRVLHCVASSSATLALIFLILILFFNPCVLADLIASNTVD